MVASAWFALCLCESAHLGLELAGQGFEADEVALGVVGADAELVHEVLRFLVGLASARSMLLRLVPASDPVMPALAKLVRVPTVSSMLMPKLLATMPDCWRA